MRGELGLQVAQRSRRCRPLCERLKAKLEQLVLDKHGKTEFLVPAHQRLQIGSLLDELMSDYRVRGLKSLGSVVSHLKPVRAHFGTWRAVALKPKDFKAYIEKRRAKGKS